MAIQTKKAKNASEKHRTGCRKKILEHAVFVIFIVFYFELVEGKSVFHCKKFHLDIPTLLLLATVLKL